MAFQFIGNKTYICVSTDVKHSADVGSILYEFDVITGNRTLYQTYDGTNWVETQENVDIQIGGGDISNTNPIPVISQKSNTIVTNNLVVVSATPTLLVGANADRLQITIQNTGISPILVKYNGEPSILDYNFAISGCAADRDGRGGAVEESIYTGSIYAVVESGASTVSITEINKQT